jgi:hypothetical protein
MYLHLQLAERFDSLVARLSIITSTNHYKSIGIFVRSWDED